MQYLIDTNWVIDYLHKVPAVVRRFQELAPEGIGISIISLAELYEGVVQVADTEREEHVLKTFLQQIKILPVDEPICRIFARERHRLRVTGDLIPDFDILIGATAIHHNLTVLTNNRRHFHRLQDITILSA